MGLLVALGRLSGTAKSMKAGTYVFSPDASMWSVLNDLSAGQVSMRSFTIPEGWTLEDPGMQSYPYIDILILNESELAKVAGGKEGKNHDASRRIRLFSYRHKHCPDILGR